MTLSSLCSSPAGRGRARCAVTLHPHLSPDERALCTPFSGETSDKLRGGGTYPRSYVKKPSGCLQNPTSERKEAAVFPPCLFGLAKQA